MWISAVDGLLILISAVALQFDDSPTTTDYEHATLSYFKADPFLNYLTTERIKNLGPIKMKIASLAFADSIISLERRTGVNSTPISGLMDDSIQKIFKK